MKPEELLYAKTHEWVHVGADGQGQKIATIGISEGLRYDSITRFSYSTAAERYPGPRARIFSAKNPVDLP